MRSDRALKGRVAVVTGAARGVGEAVARTLAGRGMRLALLGHEEAELERVAAGLPDAVAWPVDVTADRSMAEVADRVRERFGPVSVVVANAGVAAGGPFLRCDPAIWSRVVEVNLVGSAVTARVFLPSLLATRGYYLQVASLAAFAPAPMMTAYGASKAGVEAFAHALRAELAPTGVAVGVAYFGWTDTQMIAAADREPALRLLHDRMPWPAGRTYPAQRVADRLVRGIERRAPAVYAQPWLRGLHLVRPALPGLVAHGARRELRRRAPDDDDLTATGLLGRGGRADEAARREA
ncbi:SDR family oxidoreductase [Streptomyces sp. SAJ15]|uniref:SDR family oxidoreductase n=1 Tax=Streptomyces sp. SAJ15 TaxID=2011095 RepID=UPI0011854C98|nr:SDR family oxidoreductase [Streptomyces sp. SAJ15]TVL91128.1 short-chain dehydrogenase [Streptomyces sp. SAJ15]